MCIKALTLVNGSSMICYIANKIIYQSRSTLFPKDFVRKLLKMVLLNINAPPPLSNYEIPDQMLHYDNGECEVCTRF